jgi:cyclophilin family peptidyl-prolyl cis-trans isomerase
MRNRKAKGRVRRLGLLEALEARRVMAVDVLAPLADISIAAGSSSETINLAEMFDLADVTGTVVKFSTNVNGGSSIFAELFDEAGPERTRTTPATAANFLDYVDAGLYTDTVMHRSVPSFVVQGGGFALPTETGVLPTAISTFAPVVNEAGNTNVRGTIALAKVGGDENSGTSQFFFNTNNNAANLDFQNGGFTAFARVLGDGMTVVDAMAALPRANKGGVFAELPVIGTDGTGDLAPENYVTIESVAQVGELVYTVTSSDPTVASAVVTADGTLRLDYAASGFGSSTVTVRAASVFDDTDFTEQQFVVTVSSPDLAAPPVVVFGDEPGGLPWVTVIDANSGEQISKFLAFHPNNRGGVSVALGDVDGDGLLEVIAGSGAGSRSVVKVFELDGTHLAAYKTFPYGRVYQGGINVAAGDFDGSGTTDIAVVTARGVGLVHVFLIDPTAADPVPDNASRVIRSAFHGSMGGTTIAAADVGSFSAGVLTNASLADSRDELVLGSGVGISPLVQIFDASVGTPVLVRSLSPLTPGYLGGVNVAAGRYDADQIDDVIVTGGRRSGSALEVHSGRLDSNEVLVKRAAFASLVSLPVVAAALDTDGDGRINSLVVAQQGGAGSGIRLLGGTSGLEEELVASHLGFRIAATRRAALQAGG